MKKRPPKKTSRSTYKIRRRKKYLGFSLIELLTVMAFLSILIVATIIMLKPSLVKAYDGQRKSDLKKIKNALEDYYNDYNCYPPADTLQNACLGEETALSAYIRKVPCDPQTKEAYLYVPFPNVSNTCGGYRVFAKLDNDQDKAIEDVHCDGEAGCGLGDGLETYNFGVSEGVPLACGDASCDDEGVRDIIALLPTPTPPRQPLPPHRLLTLLISPARWPAAWFQPPIPLA